MDRQLPTSYYDSELDDSSSSASSPLSVSSVDMSSPYDAGRLSEDDADTSAGSLSAASSANSSNSSSSSASSRSDSPSPWPANDHYNYHAPRSVRWFRDDRGLWSERSSLYAVRRTSTPYSRSSPCKSRPMAAGEASAPSEVLIEAVRRADHAKLHQVLSKSAAFVNYVGHEGDSPLHRSCRLGNLDAVKLLVRPSSSLLVHDGHELTNTVSIVYRMLYRCATEPIRS